MAEVPGRGRRERVATRIAIFGLLGSGNIGNNGSFEVVLNHLREHYPDVEIICVCPDPDEMTRRYGIRATTISWYDGWPSRLPVPRVLSAGLKAASKGVDSIRTLLWVRKVDVVIIPGMGILETTLPLHAWGVPYALFLTALWSRVTGARLTLVSVGANVISQRVIRWLIVKTAKLASYRSFRDQQARTAMRQMGVDTSGDAVYPDLAFALPTPSSPEPPGEDSPPTIGLGVMDYSGTTLDRHRADEIFTGYIENLCAHTRDLLDAGYHVRLFTGDPSDVRAVDIIRDRIGDDRVSFTPADSLTELMVQMQSVQVVIASRFHNVMSALKLGKPTISLSYATKNDVLLDAMGMGAFCQPIRAIDVPRLLGQVHELEQRRDEITANLRAASAQNEALLQRQFDALTPVIGERRHAEAVPATEREGERR